MIATVKDLLPKVPPDGWACVICGASVPSRDLRPGCDHPQGWFRTTYPYWDFKHHEENIQGRHGLESELSP